MTKVAVIKCENYENKEVDKKVGKMLGCLHDFLNEVDLKDKNVVIKANLVSAMHPSKCATTHPSVVEAVVQYVMAKGGHCTIADSSGGPFNKAYMNNVYKATEMDKVCERTGATTNNNFSFSEIESNKAIMHKTLPIINALVDADLIINIAKLKTHTFMGYSGVVKNMFGAIPGLMKVEMHGNFKDQFAFSNYIVDIFETLKDKICLNIIDGIEGMEGEGPTGGTPIKMNCLLASTNAYGLDLIMQQIMGINPYDMPLVQVEQQRNLISENELNNIEIIGDNPATFKKRNFNNPQIEIYNKSDKKVPLFLNGFVHKVLTRRPCISKRKCKGCKKCYNHCPIKAITMHPKKDNKLYAKIDYEKCIRCFCCQELCPFNVVKIKSGIIYKVVHRKRKAKKSTQKPIKN